MSPGRYFDFQIGRDHYFGSDAISLVASLVAVAICRLPPMIALIILSGRVATNDNLTSAAQSIRALLGH